MRSTIALLFAAGLASTGASVVPSSDAYAQARERARTGTVVITPRYLTAGPLASEFEYLGSLPSVDARFSSTGRDLPGLTFQEPRMRDTWYLSRPHSSIAIDTPWGRKLPGEQ